MRREAKVLLDSGGIDVLVNNAGVLVPGYFHEQTEKQWEFMLNVNLNAAVFLTSLFLPSMYEKNSGHIVNISSAAGLLGVPGLAVYCVSKYGILGFTEALRHEARNLGKKGVRFSSVHPNFLRTGLFEGAKLSGIGGIFFPRVKDHGVIARAIVNCAIRKRQFLIRRPRSIWLSTLLRAFMPDRAFQTAVRLFGIHQGMSTLSGKGETQT